MSALAEEVVLGPRRPPDLRGRWSAWRMPPPPPGGRPEEAAVVAGWLLHCPGIHTSWEWWVLGVSHLRPLPGCEPLVAGRDVAYPGAEHELAVIALDPFHCPPDPDDFQGGILLPLDLRLQFRGCDDLGAANLAEVLAGHVADGRLVPGEGHRAAWVSRVAMHVLQVRVVR